jgi:enamine deaminase RidA (YjgF/YER057c/UK114 family)
MAVLTETPTPTQIQSETTTDAAGIRRFPKRQIREPKVLNEAYDYASPVPFVRGMRVELPGASMLYISGTSAVDEEGRSVYVGDIRAQSRRTFENIEALLASEGADWHDVVRTTCYLRDMSRDYTPFNDLRMGFYLEKGLEPFPASTCIQATICREDLLVEIEAIAVIPSDRKRS